MKRFYLGLAFVFLISEIAFSQINFSRDTTISVKENANGFKHAWVGGINAMQPSEIDLNLDGIINILDIIEMVFLILEHSDYNELADMNDDGIIDILDIVNLINIILQ